MSLDKSVDQSSERRITSAVRWYAVTAWFVSIFSVLLLVGLVLIDEFFIPLPLIPFLLLGLSGGVLMLMSFLLFHMRDSIKQHHEMQRLMEELIEAKRAQEEDIKRKGLEGCSKK